MSLLQKQLLDVRLLGLSEKDNPKTSQAGTIVDGLNWQMTKEQRVEKRPGMNALAMLSSGGQTLSGRELASLGQELMLNDGVQWYARNPLTSQWMPRGYSAYESMQILPTIATNAECNGVDSRLQMETAVIGQTAMTFMAGGDSASDVLESGWLLTNVATGDIIIPRQPSAFANVSIGTDGHTVSPTFIGFGCNPAYTGTYQDISMIIWDNTQGFSTEQDRTIISGIPLVMDANNYTLSRGSQLTCPYAACLVGDNVWLIAYNQFIVGGSSQLVVRKITRTPGPGWNVTVSDPTVVHSLYTPYAVPMSWNYTSGGTAYLAWEDQGDCSLGESIMFAPVNISTLAVGTILNTQGDGSHTWDLCRGLSVASINGSPWVFIDMTWDGGGLTGQRSVWLWTPSGATCTLLINGAGLLTQAFHYTFEQTSEVGIGIAYPSTWQPSSFLMRVRVSGNQPSGCTFGGHLQAGDFAGRPMVLQLPNFTAGATLPLGTLNNEIAPGASGNVIVSMLSLAPAVSSTPPVQGQPVEIAGTMVAPGAALKAYDGEHITEAQFYLGPESIAATVGDGQIYYLNSANTLTQSVPTTSGVMTATVSSHAALITLQSSAGNPALTSWPAGTIPVTVTAWITGGSGSYQFGLVGGEAWLLDRLDTTTGTGYAYTDRTNVPATQTLTGTAAQYTFLVPVLALSSTLPTDALKIGLLATGNDGATLHVGYGPLYPSSITTGFPVVELGTRQYTAVAAWTDAQGRIQRSQPCPPVSCPDMQGLSTNVTVPALNFTERGSPFNLDYAITPAQIEIYRTGVNDPIFYKVASFINQINGAPLSFIDSTPDADITENEQLYTTGNAVEHWPVIGCNIVCSHQGRLFAATAANDVYFTAYLSSGEGLAFAAEYLVETEHINGPLTGLFSLDSNLILGTLTAYATMGGVGPEATGVPPYDSPMVVASGIGPRGPRSYVRIPDGVVALTEHGVQLFDRSLALQNVGLPVEPEPLAGYLPWFSAVYHPTLNQIRLFRTGLALVWDWTLNGPPGRAGQWFKWQYAVNVMATAMANLGLYYLGTNGTVYIADVGLTDNGTAYQEWVQFSVVSPAGPNSWSRLYALRLMCSAAAGSTAKVVFTPEEGNLATTDTHTLAAGGGMTNIITKPLHGKGSSMNIWIGESAASATAGLTIDAIGLLVGNKGGLGQMPVTNRM